MPIYDYRCSACGEEYHNIKNAIAERRTNAPKCCDGETSIVIRPVRDAIVRNFEPYECPVTGQGVSTPSQRRDIMARHDLVEGGDIKLRTVKEY